MSGTQAIEARDLFRIYESAGGNAAALQGLTLSVREGEILVVLGPSGSGKTTLLRILAGLDRPSAGRAIVFGSDLAGLSQPEARSLPVEQTGYADQHYSRALAPELTARELVGLRLGLEGATRAERAAAGRRAARAGRARRQAATRGRTSSRGASSSASSSAPQSHTGPDCSSPTSRPASSTTRAPRCSTTCSATSRVPRAARR